MIRNQISPGSHRSRCAIAVQRDILSILAAGAISTGVYADSPSSVEVFFRDLAALGQRVLRYAEPADLRGRLPGDLWADIEPLTGRDARRDTSPAWAVTNHSSASVAAAAACLAVPILLTDSHAAAGEKLRWQEFTANLSEVLDPKTVLRRQVVKDDGSQRPQHVQHRRMNEWLGMGYRSSDVPELHAVDVQRT